MPKSSNKRKYDNDLQQQQQQEEVQQQAPKRKKVLRNERVKKSVIEQPETKSDTNVKKVHVNGNDSRQKQQQQNDKTGLIFVTGCGDVGQLGLGPDVMSKKRPTALTVPNVKFVSIVAGSMHTVGLTVDGEVYTFGCNDEGALGRITTEEDEMTEPKEVLLPAPAVQISAGDSHTVALLEDNRVFIWGNFRDTHGSMGLLKSEQVEKLPVELKLNTKIRKIASGVNHVALLGHNGLVYTFGCGEQGQLGRVPGRSVDRHSRHGLAILLKPSTVPFQAKYVGKIEDIWTGHYSTFCKVANKQDVIVFGLNNYNQLGLEDPSILTVYHPTISKEFSKNIWKDISSSTHHTIGLSQTGVVYAIGRQDYGRLGLGEAKSTSAGPSTVNGHADISMDTNGDNNDTLQKSFQSIDVVVTLTEIPKFSNDKIRCDFIATGLTTSFAISDSGTLFAWGNGDGGMLGIGSEDDAYEPVPVASQQLGARKVLKVSGGGQHTVLLAAETSEQS